MHQIQTRKTGSLLCVVALGATVAAQAEAAPSSITFEILHAGCGASSMELAINGTSIGDVAVTEGCYCNASPLTATFTDPAIMALYNEGACNSLSASHDSSIAIAYMRVQATGATSEIECFDAAANNCA